MWRVGKASLASFPTSLHWFHAVTNLRYLTFNLSLSDGENIWSSSGRNGVPPRIFSDTFLILFLPSPTILPPLNLPPQVCVFLLFASLQRPGGAAALLVTSLKPCPPLFPSRRRGAPRPSYTFIIFLLELPTYFRQDATVFPILVYAAGGRGLCLVGTCTCCPYLLRGEGN